MTSRCCVCGQPATAFLRDTQGRVWHYCAACLRDKADTPPPPGPAAPAFVDGDWVERIDPHPVTLIRPRKGVL